MITQTFINLPVKDLNRTIEFFTKLGFEFNPQFTDQNATCMILDKSSFAMLLVEKFFKTFTKKQIADAGRNTESIIALAVESRQEVDDLVQKAFEAGAARYKDPDDLGFMYGWGFQDLDGHLWEVFYMDPAKMQKSA